MISAQLDDRTHVLEDDVAAGPRGQVIAELFADYLEVRRVQSCRLVIGDGNGLDRHLRLVKERGRVIVVIDEIPVFALGFALMRRDPGLFCGYHVIGNDVERLALNSDNRLL